MANISTNAIRSFADKVRALAANKQSSLTLSATDARNLNHEIETLLALLVELQSLKEEQAISIELKSNTF